MRMICLAVWFFFVTDVFDAAAAKDFDPEAQTETIWKSRRREHQRFLTPTKEAQERRIKSSKSQAPSFAPSVSMQPSLSPSQTPSAQPSATPSYSPTVSQQPSARPSISSMPSTVPTAQPSNAPSFSPSSTPSLVPTGAPSLLPSAVPTEFPSMNPTTTPSSDPSRQPSFTPSSSPSASNAPSRFPSDWPSYFPTNSPSGTPTISNVPSFNLLGYNSSTNTAQSTVVHVQTCRRDTAGSMTKQTISYAYNMTLPTGTGVGKAMSEGERLIGEKIAEIFCAKVEDESFYLVELTSLELDAIEGSCGASVGSSCYVVDGEFTASLRVPADNKRKVRNLDETVASEIETEFQNALSTILPDVIQELSGFQAHETSTTTNVNAVSSGGSEASSGGSGGSSNIAFAVAACVVGLGLFSVFLVIGVRRRRKQMPHSEFCDGTIEHDFINTHAQSTDGGDAEVPSTPVVVHAFLMNEDESEAGDSLYGAGLGKRAAEINVEPPGIHLTPSGAIEAKLLDLGTRQYISQSNMSEVTDDTVDL